MIESVDKLVQLAQIRGGVNVHCHFQGEWLVNHPCQAHRAIVHIVIEGEGWLKVENGEYQKLKQGDIVMLSCEHQLSGSKQRTTPRHFSEPTVTQQGVMQIRKIQNGQGNELQLFCACFYYEPHAELFINLPTCFVLHLPDHVLQPILRLLRQETAQRYPSQQVINSLSTILLVTMLRYYLEQQPNDAKGILNIVQDHRLSYLIQQILSAPEQAWTIDEMVKMSYLSRAHLMRTFKQKIGKTPHAFVHNTRLQKAALLLRNSADSVLNIALACGFQSEPHFSKSFKAMFHQTPKAYRRNEENA